MELFSMTFSALVILFIIWFSPFLAAETKLRQELLHMNSTIKGPYQEMHPRKDVISLESPDDEVTADPRPWRTGHMSHHHRHIRTVHGTVNIIGWGMLLPIGMMIARYFRKLPLKCNDWYPLHILSQLSGFLIGTLGWGLGIAIRNAAKEPGMSAHGILGTIIFAFAMLQLLALCLQPNEGHEYRKCWVVCHYLLGYALIVLSMANIFEGVKNQNSPHNWRWCYGVTVGVLALTALALEVNRCIIN